MALLNREEIEAEIFAIKSVTTAHEAQLKLNLQGIKVNSFLQDLLEKELKKLPPAPIKTIKPKKIEKAKAPVGVG